jgi:hypothetical protein
MRAAAVETTLLKQQRLLLLLLLHVAKCRLACLLSRLLA